MLTSIAYYALLSLTVTETQYCTFSAPEELNIVCVACNILFT